MSKQVIALLLSIGMLFCLSSCDIAVRQAEEASADIPSEGAGNAADTSKAAGNATSEPSEPTHTHSYVAATCTSPRICSTCGETVGDALGHHFSSATCTEPQICGRCGETNGEPLGHEFAEATCLLPKTCSRCGETEGEALGHDYVNDVCSRCGEVDPDSLPVRLEELYIIDFYQYGTENSNITDTFGNVHVNVHNFYKDAQVLFNLAGEYSVFQGSIVADTAIPLNCNITITISVDGEAKYVRSDYNKLTGEIDFSVDVSGGKILTINVTGLGWGADQRIAFVDARLSKKR